VLCGDLVASPLDEVVSATEAARSFIAPNTARQGEDGIASNIGFTLPLGTAVTTRRADAPYIVTEYSVADMRQRSSEERVESLIDVAHPDFRKGLACPRSRSAHCIAQGQATRRAAPVGRQLLGCGASRKEECLEERPTNLSNCPEAERRRHLAVSRAMP